MKTKTTTIVHSHRCYMWPKNATVVCGLRPQLSWVSLIINIVLQIFNIKVKFLSQFAVSVKAAAAAAEAAAAADAAAAEAAAAEAAAAAAAAEAAAAAAIAVIFVMFVQFPNLG